MWKHIPLEWKGIIVGIFVGGVLAFIGAQRARAAEDTASDLCDHAVAAQNLTKPFDINRHLSMVGDSTRVF